LESEKPSSLWSLALLGALFSIFGLLAWLKIKPVDAKTKEKHPRKNAGHEKKPLSPVVTNKLEAVEPLTDKNGTEHKRHKVHPYLKFGVSVLTLFAVIWYACEARKQRVTMDNTFRQVANQTTLMRQQLAGTQGAIIDQSRLMPGMNAQKEAQIIFANFGHVNAHVSATISVIRLLPDGIEKLLNRDDFTNLMAPGFDSKSLAPLTRTYNVSEVEGGFTKDDFKAIEADTPKQVLVMKGKYTWDDGFGTTYSNVPFCFSWMSHPAVTFASGTSEGAGGGFTPCNTWDLARKGVTSAQKR